MKTIGFLVVVGIVGSLAVDRTIFKTCDQSGFCQRLRRLKPDISQYVLNLDTIIIKGNSLTAEVVTVDQGSEQKTVLWHYALKLSSLVDGTFHIELDEAEPLYPRYRTQKALDGEPTPDELKLVSNEEGKLTVSNTQGHKVVITADPLKFEFLDKNGEVAMVLNGNSQLLVEPLKAKPENGEFWAETFKNHQDSKPRGNEAVSLDISFPDADQVYGIPEHTDTFALSTTTSGDPYRLYNLDVFEYEVNSRMAIYGSVPVLYAHGSKRTVGVFWHNSAETWVDVVNYNDATVVSSLVNFVTGGNQKKVDTRFMSESGIVDVFVMMGDTPSQVFRQYTRLTGVAPLPPKFSLGYHQSRWNYVDEKDVATVHAGFDQHDIPLDVIWLDIEYAHTKKYFTWDPVKFATPANMVANLTAKGRKLVVIIDPHIKREPGYFVHEDMLAKDLYVKDKTGKVYEGWCWPGASSYPDFFNPATFKYYKERYLFENFPGTSKDVHIWNDMSEPSVFNGPEVTMPKDCKHYKPPQEGQVGLAAYWEHRHVHNEYGLWHLWAGREALVERTGGKYRPFILSRAIFSGLQRYAAVWTGDNLAEWSHLAASVRMCLSLAISGVSFCGADVGGFFHYPNAELMTRWYQAGAYQPFFRAHSHIETKRREPWLYDAPTAQRIRDAIRRRYTLVDMWATLFYEHHREGLPIMRPIFEEYPKEVEAFAIGDQYLLGQNLLVRPVVDQGATRAKVYLPGRDSGVLWYDVDTYEVHKANGYFVQEANIAKIPVYQRGGSIIPRKERVRRATQLMADDPYTLVVALDAKNTATGTVFIDDGETFDYREGKYIYARFSYDKNGITYKFIDEKSSYPTRSWVERIVIAGIQEPPKAASLRQGDVTTTLQMTLHSGNDVLVIRKPGASMEQEWSIEFTY